MTTINKKNFNCIYKGKEISLFTLKNKNNICVQITNFGCKIVSISVPDRYGKFSDIVLGYETAEEYISGNPFFGAIVGRFANRIANGHFSLQNQEYQLPINNGPNSLHGGPDGFNNQVFDIINQETTENGESISMFYVSSDGEAGYPGTLRLEVTYTLTDSNELRLDFYAITDKATHVNICSHPFFNLSGEGVGDILSHYLTINSKYYTPVNEFQIPTGELVDVISTPMDFSTPFQIGARINNVDNQLSNGAGYDHNWVIDKKDGELEWAATCSELNSGRAIEIYTLLCADIT